MIKIAPYTRTLYTATSTTDAWGDRTTTGKSSFEGRYVSITKQVRDGSGQPLLSSAVIQTYQPLELGQSVWLKADYSDTPQEVVRVDFATDIKGNTLYEAYL